MEALLLGQTTTVIVLLLLLLRLRVLAAAAEDDGCAWLRTASFGIFDMMHAKKS